MGAILCAARKDAGLTAADVSRQLHLAESVVDALESNEYGELPTAFVRGYVRAYAKLLDLDGEALVGIFNRRGAGDPNIAPVTALASQHSRGDPLMRWMSAVVVAVLAVLVVVYWQTEHVVPPPVPVTTAPAPAGEPASEPEPEPAPVPDPVAAAEPMRAPVPEPAPAPAGVNGDPGGTGVPADAVPAPAAPGASFDAASAGAPAGAPAPRYEVAAMERTAPPIGRTASTRPAGEGATAVAPAAAAAGTDAAAGSATSAPPAPADPERAAWEAVDPAPLPTGPDELQLTITGESWVEVTDADGTQVSYGLFGATGNPLHVFGRAPFTVFLGNSPDVTLFLNGEPRDQSAFNRANHTARFTVDADGLSRP